MVSEIKQHPKESQAEKKRQWDELKFTYFVFYRFILFFYFLLLAERFFCFQYFLFSSTCHCDGKIFSEYQFGCIP